MADLEAIYDLAKDTNEQVTKMSGQLGAIEERCKSHQKQINGHQVTLYGQDGKGGIVADMGVLNKCKESISASRKWWGGVLQEIVKWAAIAAIGFILFLWKTHPQEKEKQEQKQNQENQK